MGARRAPRRRAAPATSCGNSSRTIRLQLGDGMTIGVALLDPAARTPRRCARIFCAGGVEIAAVEEGHAAADLFLRAHDLDAVVLEHLHGGLADRRVVVVDQAGGEERHLERGRLLDALLRAAAAPRRAAGGGSTSAGTSRGDRSASACRGGCRPIFSMTTRLARVAQRPVASAPAPGWRACRSSPCRASDASRSGTPSRRVRCAFQRSSRRGKSSANSCGGVYGQFG